MRIGTSSTTSTRSLSAILSGQSTKSPSRIFITVGPEELHWSSTIILLLFTSGKTIHRFPLSTSILPSIPSLPTKSISKGPSSLSHTTSTRKSWRILTSEKTLPLCWKMNRSGIETAQTALLCFGLQGRSIRDAEALEEHMIFHSFQDGGRNAAQLDIQ